MQHILVLSGGTSDERSVSIRSGASVASALKEAGYTVSMYDPANGIDGLIEQAKTVDIVFPVLHGIGGEDGSVQQILEENQIRFVGSGSKASRRCFDKAHYKTFLQSQSLPTPEGLLVTEDVFFAHPLVSNSFVLKPTDGGSSIDTFIVRDPALMPTDDIREAFRRHPAMLLESMIQGTEITVGVLDGTALPVVEIVPPAEQNFDFENKYNGATKELCPPETVAEVVQEKAKDLAVAIHAAAECAGLSRTDMIIDDQEQLWVLETNTLPGMTTQSLYPKAAQAAGISMPQLVDRLVSCALR